MESSKHHRNERVMRLEGAVYLIAFLKIYREESKVPIVITTSAQKAKITLTPFSLSTYYHASHKKTTKNS